MTNALLYARHGSPLEVLYLGQETPPAMLAPGQVRLGRFLAPINPADLNAIEGIYPVRPDRFPAVPGVEGIAVVMESRSQAVPEGTVVLLPHRYGTWREGGVMEAEALTPVPPGVPVAEAAMLKINPATAWRMLHDFVAPRPGAWVLQNAANSAVGRHVIAFAKELGLRTVNLVRRPELIDELLSAGADRVLLDVPDAPIAESTDGEPIQLALNAVGGDSATRLGAVLASGGVHVTYGAMSRKAMKVPAGPLIFRDIAYRGFWISRWYEQVGRQETLALFDHLFHFARRGVLSTPVERIYPVSEGLEAVERAMQGRRSGKVLIGQAPLPAGDGGV